MLERLTSSRAADVVEAAARRLALADPRVVVPSAEDTGVDFVPNLDGRVLMGGVLDETIADAGSLATRRRESAPRLVLYVHVAAQDLETGSGVARGEGRGALTFDRVAEWAGRFPVVARSVIDLSERISVDADEVPDRLREQILARDPVCVFPWCGVRSHRRDIDHITPYSPTGPPGQTHSDNLAPLCRTHHRLKTHGGWSYRRDRDGSYLWSSPEGRRYVVNHLGAGALEPVARPCPSDRVSPGARCTGGSPGRRGCPSPGPTAGEYR